MEDGAEVEDRLGGTGRGVNFFFSDESYLNPTLYLQSCLIRGVIFFDFFWGGFGKIQGRIRIGVILWSFLVILPPILP
jgi:hypothetical protein